MTIPPLRVSGAVNNSFSGNSAGSTLYTCPANSYAVVRVRFNTAAPAGTVFRVTVASFTVASATVGSIPQTMTNLTGQFGVLGNNFPLTNSQGDFNTLDFIVGPGQAVAWASTTVQSYNVSITGVQFGP